MTFTWYEFQLLKKLYLLEKAKADDCNLLNVLMDSTGFLNEYGSFNFVEKEGKVKVFHAGFCNMSCDQANLLKEHIISILKETCVAITNLKNNDYIDFNLESYIPLLDRTSFEIEIAIDKELSKNLLEYLKKRIICTEHTKNFFQKIIDLQNYSAVKNK